MATITKSLFNLTAADLMSHDVVAVPHGMSLEGAARLLSRAQVTGAPVVDDEGRCIGVISSTDFIHWAERGKRARTEASPCVCAPWQIMETEEFPDACVREYMTADPVTMAPDIKLGELAHSMLEAHIHRIIVVDKRQRPIGIVSSTDILAAVARSYHERGGQS